MPVQIYCTVIFSLVFRTLLAARTTRIEVGVFSGGLEKYQISADKPVVQFLPISLSMH